MFAEQDLGDEMYLVRSGQVSVMQDVGGEQTRLDVVADEDTSLLVLHKNDFRSAVQDYPDIAFEVFREFTRRLRSSDLRYRKLMEEARRLGLETR